MWDYLRKRRRPEKPQLPLKPGILYQLRAGYEGQVRLTRVEGDRVFYRFVDGQVEVETSTTTYNFRELYEEV